MNIDCHMHTPLCGHARGNPTEYVQAAAQRGIQLMTFTCHVPMNVPGFGGPGIRMDEGQLNEYFTIVNRAKREGEFHGIEVLCGIEAEVFPDEEIMESMDATLELCDFDFILGSLHHHVAAYQKWIKKHRLKEDEEIIEHYFAHLIDGVFSGRYHSMAHPDVIRIYGTVETFDPLNHQTIITQFLKALVKKDVCMEINTSGLTKGVYQVHPDPQILEWAAPLGVKLTIGSDAHAPESVGQKFDEVRPMLKQLGFTDLHYHRRGRRERVPIR